MRGGPLAAGLTLLCLGACQETPGELDPDVVHDLSRLPGDGDELDLGGTYSGQLTIVECGCPKVGALEMRSLCNGMGEIVPEVGQSGFVLFDVVQTDGILMLRLEGLALTGPIYADGEFTVGGLFDMTTAITSGSIVTRLDGTFDLDTDRPEVEAVARVRLQGDAAIDVEPDAEGGGDPDADRTSLDCLERYEITGSR